MEVVTESAATAPRAKMEHARTAAATAIGKSLCALIPFIADLFRSGTARFVTYPFLPLACGVALWF